MPANVNVLFSDRHMILEELKLADLVIGSILIPGAKAPRLVRREDLRLMKPGSVVIDVAIDQGGCFETSRPTTHQNPTYIVDEVVHYCVTNMPGAVGRTSTFAMQCDLALHHQDCPSGGRASDKPVPRDCRVSEHRQRARDLRTGRQHVQSSAQTDCGLVKMTSPRTIQWIGTETGNLRLIDQTQLPGRLVWLDCQTPEETWHAIKRLSVRGAPAIGIAAAYGVVLSLGEEPNAAETARAAIDYLATSRPTAVNLFWALDKIRAVIDGFDGESGTLRAAILAKAIEIHDHDRECCHAMGRNGATLLDGCVGVLTHCNAGGLATGREYGTAVAVVYEAAKKNSKLKVYADETRPLLQGARLTAWELQQAGIDVTVICDSMAAQVMKEGASGRGNRRCRSDRSEW